MIIYKITNLINGKIYIGQTVNAEKRKRSHFNNPLSRMLIGRAIIKYGKENFSFDVIDSGSSYDDLNSKEIYWISKLESMSPRGYNILSGGRNKSCSQETIEKIRKSNKGKVISPETIEKIRAANTGKKQTAEAIRKRSKSLINYNKTARTINGVSVSKDGKYSSGMTLNRKRVFCGDYYDIEYAKMAGDMWRVYYFQDEISLNNKFKDVVNVINFLIIILNYAPDLASGMLRKRYDVEKVMAEEERANRRSASKASANNPDVKLKCLLKKLILGPSAKGASIYKGVSYNKKTNKWYARLWVNGKAKHLGTFSSDVLAAKAYDLAVIKYYHRYDAYLNFPEIFEHFY